MNLSKVPNKKKNRRYSSVCRSGVHFGWAVSFAHSFFSLSVGLYLSRGCPSNFIFLRCTARCNVYISYLLFPKRTRRYVFHHFSPVFNNLLYQSVDNLVAGFKLIFFIAHFYSLALTRRKGTVCYTNAHAQSLIFYTYLYLTWTFCCCSHWHAFQCDQRGKHKIKRTLSVHLVV